MKQKLVMSIAALTVLCSAAVAQSSTAKVGGTTFGIRAGVNFQNINGKNANGDKIENTNLVTRFHAGVNAEVPVAPEFYFQPGLLFTTKGAKSEGDFFGIPGSSTVHLSYVEMPLNFVYKPTLGAGHLILGIGPYVALGVGGKVETTFGNLTNESDVKFKNKVNEGEAQSNTVYFRPVDAGGNLLFGYEFSNRLSAQVNAQLGLTKINADYEGSSGDKTALKNTGFGLSLGYRF